MRADLDLSKMTVEDLFRAKAERRKKLADLPFEEKIEILKRLRSASRTIREQRRVNEDPTLPREVPPESSARP